MGYFSSIYDLGRQRKLIVTALRCVTARPAVRVPVARSVQDRSVRLRPLLYNERVNISCVRNHTPHGSTERCARPPPRFFMHHLRLISLAAVIGAAFPVAVWAKARKSHLQSGTVVMPSSTTTGRADETMRGRRPCPSHGAPPSSCPSTARPARAYSSSGRARGRLQARSRG